MPPRHLLLVVVACNAWALNFIASAVVLEHWPPFLFTIVRFCLVALLLLPFLSIPPRVQWPRLAAVTLLNGAVHFSLYFFALDAAADISSIAILMQLYVPLAALLAWVLLGERFGATTALSILAAFAGVLLVGLDPVIFTRLAALAFALAGAFCLALGTTLMRGLDGVGPFAFQGWTALISLPVLALASALGEDQQLRLLMTAPWPAWAGVAFSAVGASIVGHGIFFWLIRRHPVARVTTCLLLTPVLAIGYGVLFWGDRPGWRLLVGAALVLGGVLMISLRSGARRVRSAASRRR